MIQFQHTLYIPEQFALLLMHIFRVSRSRSCCWSKPVFSFSFFGSGSSNIRWSDLHHSYIWLSWALIFKMDQAGCYKPMLIDFSVLTCELFLMFYFPIFQKLGQEFDFSLIIQFKISWQEFFNIVTFQIPHLSMQS